MTFKTLLAWKINDDFYRVIPQRGGGREGGVKKGVISHVKRNMQHLFCKTMSSSSKKLGILFFFFFNGKEVEGSLGLFLNGLC